MIKKTLIKIKKIQKNLPNFRLKTKNKKSIKYKFLDKKTCISKSQQKIDELCEMFEAQITTCRQSCQQKSQKKSNNS